MRTCDAKPKVLYHYDLSTVLTYILESFLHSASPAETGSVCGSWRAWHGIQNEVAHACEPTVIHLADKVVSHV